MPLQWEELEREMDLLQARMDVVTGEIDRLVAIRDHLRIPVYSDEESGYDSDVTTEEEPGTNYAPVRPWGQSSQWDPEFLADHDDDDEEDIMIIDGSAHAAIQPARLNFEPMISDDEETVALGELASFNRARVYEDGECSDTETVVEDYNEGYAYTRDFVESLWD